MSHEQLLAPVAVRQLAEEQRADAGARHVERRGGPDVGGVEVDAAARLGHPRRDRADDRDLEPVEHPDGAQADDDPPVEPRPRQAVQPRRDVGPDRPEGARARGHRRPRRRYGGQRWSAAGCSAIASASAATARRCAGRASGAAAPAARSASVGGGRRTLCARVRPRGPAGSRAPSPARPAASPTDPGNRPPPSEVSPSPRRARSRQRLGVAARRLDSSSDHSLSAAASRSVANTV